MTFIESSGPLIALVVLIVITLVILYLLLKLFVEVLPSLVVAGVVYWLSDGNVLLTIVGFIASAILFAIIWHLIRR